MVKLSDLRVRDVVSLGDGKRLGMVADVVVDLADGRITALVVPGPGRLLGLFGHDRDYVIAWEDIVKIGADVILVDLSGRSSGGAGRPRDGGEPPTGGGYTKLDLD